MLTYAELAELARSARDRMVLNVYVDPSELDAVARRSWRRTLADAIVDVRKSLSTATHAERAEYDKAAARVEKLAEDLSDDLDGAPGWAAFADAKAVLYAGPTHRPPRTGLLWRPGLAAARYLRLFDDDGGVVVVLLDGRSADLYRWNGREVAHLERINAHAHVGRAAHMGDAPREGCHAGTRGTALTDAAQRALEAGRERMLHSLTAQLEALARPAGWIVMGGARNTVTDAMKQLTKTTQKRALFMPGLNVDASEADIAAVAAEGRRRLESERDLSRVNELLDRAVGRGRAVAGFQPSLDALLAASARDILVSTRFLDEHPDDADTLGATVLTHGARLEEMSGDAGARLDAAGGVAATLRFPSRSGRVRAGLTTARV